MTGGGLALGVPLSLRQGRWVDGYSCCVISRQGTRDVLDGIWAKFLEINNNTGMTASSARKPYFL